MNKIDLLKKLLPGMLPLIVFIIADEIWGTKIGLIVAIGVGIAELAYIGIKEKRIDKFIITDTGLIIVLGLVSILLDNDIFFKLKPALVEFILCIILGISTFSSKNIMLAMSKRYMKGINIDKNQQKQLNRSVRILFYIFSVHTLLVIYSAYFMSKEAWAFISGGLFYILFGVYFVGELIRNRLKISKYKNEEILPIVDEEGKIKGKAPRSLCHQGPGMLHPVVHLHVINKKKEIFLQKRPIYKNIQPDKWDTAVGGHISFGEELEIGLKREAEEEIGIKEFKPHLISKYKWETDKESELVFMFYTYSNSQLKINKEELADGRFWKIKDIKKNLGQGIFTSNFEMEFEMLSKVL